MNVVVIANASRTGGALSIYLQFLNHLEKEIGEDHYFIFIDPQMPIRRIIGADFIPVRATGFGRIWFDFYGFNNLLKNKGMRVDVIFSLQRCHS